ncbi:Nramp family divalent metal transporter [Streptomyces sp. NPDC056738]|uniref:Nramp family divalent metal transporter n=1 Tax=Streptomyces sp. NPDC056738 TaxID=3345933 RepID=UPI003694C0DD
MRRPTSPVAAGAGRHGPAVTPYGPGGRAVPNVRAAVYGPAFVAAVAYADPGNFASNTTAGSAYGYGLLWVVAAAGAMAMLIQYVAAKLGTVTGRGLGRLCREHLPRPVVYGLWAQAELVAVATDLAEIVGGALALRLLFGLPVLLGGVLVATVSCLVLAAEGKGARRFESLVAGVLAVVVIGVCYDIVAAPPSPTGMAHGMVPSFPGADSPMLAAGMLGATVMPHVIYLHPVMAARRLSLRSVAGTDPAHATWLLRRLRTAIVVSLGVAGAVNAALLLIGARIPGFGDDLDSVHARLGETVGSVAAAAFAMALLASGLVSSSVGTYAGQVIMTEFLDRQVPVWFRRGATLVPALSVLALGVNPTTALVWSQVVLSFGIPFALVPLVWLTGRGTLMGARRNGPLTQAALSVVTAAVIGLNVFLLVQVAAEVG